MGERLALERRAAFLTILGDMTFEELERAWQDAPPLPRGRGGVRRICVRTGGGAHACPPRVRVTCEGGVDGDRWAREPQRRLDAQVTLIAARVAEWIARPGSPPEAAGDNFHVDLDVGVEALPVGTRIRLGTAVVEVTALPHSGCAKFRDRFGLDAVRWVNDPGHRERRLRGVNCRVIADGEVAVDDAVELVRGIELSRV